MSNNSRKPDEEALSIEKEFIIPVSDQHGHSEKITFRLSSGMSNQVNRILSSSLFPYRGRGHLLRHALLRHFQYLETLKPVPSIRAQVEAMQELLKDMELNSEFDEMLVAANEMVEKYLMDGRTKLARQLVLRLLDKVRQMPEGEWRGQYQKSIETKWGPLLEGKKASLLGRNATDEEDK